MFTEGFKQSHPTKMITAEELEAINRNLVEHPIGSVPEGEWIKGKGLIPPMLPVKIEFVLEEVK